MSGDGSTSNISGANKLGQQLGQQVGGAISGKLSGHNKTQDGRDATLAAAISPLEAKAAEIQSWYGGGGSGYGYGYGSGGYAAPDYDDLWSKAIAQDKQNQWANNVALKSNLNRLNLANQAIGKIAKAQERAIGLEANSNFFQQDAKLQAARQAIANAAGQLPWSSASSYGLENLTGLQRDFNTNEILTTKRNSLTDVYNNKYNAEMTNEINALKAISEYLNNTRQSKTGMVNIADQYEKGDQFYAGKGKNRKLKVKDKSDLGYINNYINDAKKLYNQWKGSTAPLQTVGLTRPDGPNRANSNPLVTRNQNTNSNNRAGSVANKNTENFYNALHAGYDSRDKNMSRTQIETGR